LPPFSLHGMKVVIEGVNYIIEGVNNINEDVDNINEDVDNRFGYEERTKALASLYEEGIGICSFALYVVISGWGIRRNEWLCTASKDDNPRNRACRFSAYS
ncbi:MAG: hypothetical protein RR249_02000, partial [Tannerellaceae bacterium]